MFLQLAGRSAVWGGGCELVWDGWGDVSFTEQAKPSISPSGIKA